MASRSQWKLWRALTRRKGREEHGLHLAEGPNLLAELLDAGSPPQRVLYTPSARADPGTGALVERCEAAGVPVVELSEDELAELADTVTPQGILAVVRTPRSGWQDLGSARILVLDAVQDPGNLGTLVRTADAVGIGGIVCLPGTVEPWNPKAVRAGAGSAYRVPVLSATWEEARGRIRELGAEVWAAAPEGRPFARGDRAPARLALVLGNEAHGVSAEVREAADRTVSIPMVGPVESLNVAVAGAILLDRLFGGDAAAGDRRERGAEEEREGT